MRGTVIRRKLFRPTKKQLKYWSYGLWGMIVFLIGTSRIFHNGTWVIFGTYTVMMLSIYFLWRLKRVHKKTLLLGLWFLITGFLSFGWSDLIGAFLPGGDDYATNVVFEILGTLIAPSIALFVYKDRDNFLPRMKYFITITSAVSAFTAFYFNIVMSDDSYVSKLPSISIFQMMKEHPEFARDNMKFLIDSIATPILVTSVILRILVDRVELGMKIDESKRKRMPGKNKDNITVEGEGKMEPLIRRGFVYLYFDNMRNYSEEMEETLERRLRDHEEEYQKIFQKETDEGEYRDFLVDQYQDRKYELTDAYPTLLRSSLMISIYSLIEKELQDVCARLQKKKGIKMHLKDADLREQTKKGFKNPPEIVRAQKYLKEYCGVKFPDQADEWKQITDGYRIIRNKFVHDGQYASKNEVDKFKEIEKLVLHFRLDDEHRELVLEKEFCEKFILTGEYFFMRLYDAVRESMNGSTNTDPKDM